MVADPMDSVSVFLVNVPNESGVRPLEPQVQDAGSNGIGGEFSFLSRLPFLPVSAEFSYVW